MKSVFPRVESGKLLVREAPEVTLCTGRFETHGFTGWNQPVPLPISPLDSFDSQLMVALDFQLFAQQMFIAQVLWTRHLAGHWRNTRTQARNVPWKHRGQFHQRRQSTNNFISNCSTTILTGATKGKWKMFIPRGSDSLGVQGGCLWEWMLRQGSETWVGKRGPERAFQAEGAWAKALRKENHGEAVGGQLPECARARPCRPFQSCWGFWILSWEQKGSTQEF